MTKLNCVDLDAFLERFSSLEQSITKVHSNSSLLQLRLEDSGRLLKHSQSGEKALEHERNCLLSTVKELQQSLEAQCHIRVENERLQNALEEMKREDAKKTLETEARVQRLVSEMRAEADHQQRALEALRWQGRREVEESHTQAALQMEAKEAEMRQMLQQKEQELEELQLSLKEHEREHNSEMLKLQMEFGAKLARVQSSAQMNQQQQYGPNLPQNIFKRKLQFFQEEKNKEVAVLQQRIRELEESQLTGLKLRKVTFNI